MEDLLTVREVAHQLRVDAITVRRWIKDGSLEAVLLPSARTSKRRKYRIKRETMARIMEPLRIS